ncbi:MFS transporter [Curtobacterium sp. PhB115]|uniref:MFS transporter n=1 Tax=Curtobacterium sp. PhB115 TaxID=2485173 RepID=UPI000F4CEAD8|nr:MFS transporter [Curtobacterium sp. PhB115]ROP65452.1 DHA1 family inner membrane transport protein [Curtobacterium sp. PhB115]
MNAPTSTRVPVRVTAGAQRLPIVVPVLAVGTFLMITTEFVIAGILPGVAADLHVSLGRAGLLITVFAIGMIIGSPLMTLLTIRLPKRRALLLALALFVAGHFVVALAEGFTVLLIARLVTAFATGAFWSVASVVAARAAGPQLGSRAQGVVGAGGSLGTVLGVPLGAFLAQAVGWRGTFWAIAAAAVVLAVLVARFVPRDAATGGHISIRGEFSGLRSGRLWLTLLACVTTSGGVVSAYSYIAPVLTDRAGIAAGLVPVVLTAFGVGSFIGTLLGGRLGDARPGLVTIVTPAASTVLLVLIGLVTDQPILTAVLVAVLGLFGLSANGVLIHTAVHAAGDAAPLGSALTVSAFNLGTAIGTALVGVLLDTTGVAGPALIGAGIVALTLIPTTLLATVAARQRRI